MRVRILAALFLASTLMLSGTTPGMSEEQERSGVRTKPKSVSGADALPNAKPGECYAKVLLPAEYKTETEQVIKRDPYEKIEITPAKYETVTEKIMVKQASDKLIPVDPVFDTIKERVETRPARRIWRLGKSSKAKAADNTLVSGALALGLPATAEIGQCFAEYYKPVEYNTKIEDVIVREAYQGIEVVPAKYETVEEQVVVKDASVKLVEVPPVYETVKEQVLQAPAYTTWKAGRGPVERIDHSTGDIMCLVEVPAKYKTVTKQVLKSPSTTQKIEVPAQKKKQMVRKLVSAAQFKNTLVPAESKTVSKKVMVSEAKIVWQLAGLKGPGKHTGRTLCLHEIAAKHEVITKQMLKTPATTKKVEIPAEYKTQQVRKLVSASQEKRTQVPAEVSNITRRVKIADAKLEWRPVLCQTNMSKELNTQIQKALAGRGFNPGKIDGVLGQQTMVAVGQFQEKEGLPRGGLTLRTLSVLGIDPGKERRVSDIRTQLQ